jgi:AcrR family transcriptional regulator
MPATGSVLGPGAAAPTRETGTDVGAPAVAGAAAAPAGAAQQAAVGAAPATEVLPGAAGPAAPTWAAVPAVTATASQQARRERMLTAALTLASRGGYDEVQMREVAEQAGVALGTLYRYFPSKVHLLASALARHLTGLRGTVLADADQPADPAMRVLAVMNRLVDELSRDRQVAEALIQAMTSASATVGTEIDNVEEVMISLIGAAAFGPDHVVDERDKLITNIIGRCFLSDLRYWQGNRMSLDEVRASMKDTVAVVLAGQRAVAPDRSTPGPAAAAPATPRDRAGGPG